MTRVGDVANTAAPLPVSSVSAAERLAEEKEPSEVALPIDVIAPVRLALVTTVAANEPVPLPVTPPVRVMVWSPVFVPLRLLPVTAPVAAIVLLAVTVVNAPVDGREAPIAVFVRPTDE